MGRAPADPRRADLALEYVHRPEPTSGSPTTMFSSTLPMAGIFLRSKLIAWCSLFTALQQYLNEPVHSLKKEESSPAWITLITAFTGIAASYSDFIFKRPVPPALQNAAETATAAAENIITTAISS